MSDARLLPVWARIALIGEVLLGFCATVLLAVVFLAFTTQPSSIDMIVVFAVAAVPLVVTAGAAALARWFWRRGEDGWATAIAVVPIVLGVPFLAMLLGVGY